MLNFYNFICIIDLVFKGVLMKSIIISKIILFIFFFISFFIPPNTIGYVYIAISLLTYIILLLYTIFNQKHKYISFKNIIKTILLDIFVPNILLYFLNTFIKLPDYGLDALGFVGIHLLCNYIFTGCLIVYNIFLAIILAITKLFNK